MSIASVILGGFKDTIASLVRGGFGSLNAVAPTVTTTTLYNGAVGVAYSTQLEATGDVTITWDITVGVLPAGLSLSTDGVISGTPTTEESQNFTVRATNASGNDTQALTLAIGLASAGGGQARDGHRYGPRGMLVLVGRG